MLTKKALTMLRQQFLENIASATYTTGGIVQETAIASSGLLDDGRASVSLLIEEAKSSGEAVTLVCLYDAAGDLLVEKTENIVREPSMGSVYYRLFFSIDEVGG